MKHTTLYRKWRPRRFGSIVGQEPVVRTLRRAIETDRVSHAYLFSGPRGTGKTSTAKVLAMGLNCEKGPTPEPDGTCDSCRAIMGNSSMDVLEMDAASNRGIDEIRDLRDKVNLAPVAGRMRVYIIDEVHMLTAEAFNALLKMLEEPPEHVVFVLATTEKHKVLPTIISRCQSFDFRRPSVETLVEKLGEISEAEGIEVEPEALTVIAREGRGSFRDAEGLLDQLSSFAEGTITASMVRELLGGVGPEALIETTYALHERRAADALRIVDRLSNGGKDLAQFVGELLAHLRNLMLLPYAPEVALAGVGAEERPPLEEQANAVPTAEVVRLVTALDDALSLIRRGGDPKLELEIVFLKLTRDYTEPDMATILARLETLEKAVENGGVVTNSPRAATDTVREEPPAERESPQEAVESDAPSDEPSVLEDPDAQRETNVDLASEWQAIMGELKRRRQALTAAVYGEARVESFDGEVLRLVYPEEQSFHVGMAKDSGHLEKLAGVLEERLGSKPRLEIRAAGGEASATSTAEEPTPMEQHAPVSQESPPETGSPNGSGGTVAENSGSEPASMGDDKIRDQREVFEIAREAGLFDKN
ncbi:MAG: DNA polymerase III subunit gamma/tau [Rubrobacteraceae bacterium]|nr:DNA polymerase III subunit gamma/tau [Rubrobacteraceae bacterium]MBA3617562.1 DNA polymerase III subunit gamma/tau [Rubrobacteraceae bacterium]MDQ3438145.1 DNA polymerase III subunit gamma/tau [Actinomycetota bacterium]